MNAITQHRRATGRELGGAFSAWRLGGVFCFLFVAVMLAYSDAFFNGFVLDDQSLIVSNVLLREWRNAWLFFVSSHSMGGGVASPFYRPLQPLIYMVVYHAAGLQPWAYHAANIGLHCLNTCLVYVLGRRIGFKPVPVFLAALVWGLHPVHVEAVSYASATADVLYVFFCLCSLIVMVPALTQRRIFFAVPFFILGLLSKETAAILPLLAATLIYLIRPTAKARFYATLWPLVAVLVVYLGGREISPIFANFDLYNPPDAYADSWFCRLNTFFATLPAYGRLLVWPSELHMERSFPSFVTMAYERVWLGILIFAVGVGVIIKARNTPSIKFLAWGVSWFFAAILPQTGIALAINGQLMEHWLYLPSIGLVLALAGSFGALSHEKLKRIVAGTALIMAMCLGNKTYAQNKNWHDPLTFFSHITTYPDHLPRANIGLAIAFIDQDAWSSALAQLDEAISLSQDTSAQAQYIYGLVLQHQAASKSDIQQAIGHFNRALELYPDSFETDQALVKAYTSLGDLDQAFYYHQQAALSAEKITKTYVPPMALDKDLFRR